MPLVCSRTCSTGEPLESSITIAPISFWSWGFTRWWLSANVPSVLGAQDGETVGAEDRAHRIVRIVRHADPLFAEP
jgi:hypothetical protein